MTRIAILGSLILISVACEVPGPDLEPVFVDGRAVAPSGDTLLAITAPGMPGVLLYDRRDGTKQWMGVDELSSPAHVQWSEGHWYVSDVNDGLALVTVFTPDGRLADRLDLASHAAVAHQFAVLPGGQIIVETADDRLVAIRGDSVVTFALIDESPRTGMLVAARGGVLHVVPNRTLTLYNGLGKIRWRKEWPWVESLFLTDLAVDSRGRPMILAGLEGRDGFVVYGLDAITGEVIIWMEGPTATFSIRKYGDIQPDTPSNWTAGS
ncbi:MAG: hypothetical protein JSW71_24225 [Gemmatimonadota bacterium]|nr:MAG: hypothetical protein JSW71_24225 [Gemmatimonadota bacterium]